MNSLPEDLIATARALNELGINQGTAGNVSARTEAGMCITPSGMPYDRISPADLVTVAWDGSHRCPHRHPPSSEWRLHLDLLAARPDLGAVVHTHGVGAASIACLRRELPPFHYMVAVAGGTNIRCAPYATFGTAALSAGVLKAMADRRACLLANHGLVAAGTTLAQALSIALEVEALCQMYGRCLAVAEPPHLSADEMEAVLAQFNAGIGAGPAFAVQR